MTRKQKTHFPELMSLLEQARKSAPMTPEQRREQAISFVFGNLHISNPTISKEMVAATYDALKAGKIPDDR